MIFEVVRRVFDFRCYEYGYDDADISRALVHLIDNYSNDGLKKAADAINYVHPALRYAYIYLYSTSHSQMVADTLLNLYNGNFKEFKNWMNGLYMKNCPSFNVCSIGGGPGSDILGILQFFLELSWQFCDPIYLNLTLVDAYYGWEETFKDFLEEIGHQITWPFYVGKTVFLPEDLLKTISPYLEWQVRNADLLSMVKFVSAVSADAERCLLLLREILRLMKPESWILYVDNSGGTSFKIFNSVVISQGFEAIYGPLNPYRFHVNRGREPMDGVRAYVNRFGMHPQTSSTLVVGIWKKPLNACQQGLKRTISFDASYSETMQGHKCFAYGDFSEDYLTPFKNMFVRKPIRKRFTNWPSNKDDVKLDSERSEVRSESEKKDPSKEDSMKSSELMKPERHKDTIGKNQLLGKPNGNTGAIQNALPEPSTFCTPKCDPALPERQPSLLGNSPFHIPDNFQENISQLAPNSSSLMCTPHFHGYLPRRPSLLGNSPFHIPEDDRRRQVYDSNFHNINGIQHPSSSSISKVMFDCPELPQDRSSLVGGSSFLANDAYQGNTTISHTFINGHSPPGPEVKVNTPHLPIKISRKGNKCSPCPKSKFRYTPTPSKKMMGLRRKFKTRAKRVLHWINSVMVQKKKSPLPRNKRQWWQRNRAKVNSFH